MIMFIPALLINMFTTEAMIIPISPMVMKPTMRVHILLYFMAIVEVSALMKYKKIYLIHEIQLPVFDEKPIFYDENITRFRTGFAYDTQSSPGTVSQASPLKSFRNCVGSDIGFDQFLY